MTESNSPVMQALSGARTALHLAERRVAESNAGQGRGAGDAAMADTARVAVFTEALLRTVHARLAELQAVTKP